MNSAVNEVRIKHLETIDSGDLSKIPTRDLITLIGAFGVSDVERDRWGAVFTELDCRFIEAKRKALAERVGG